MAVGLRRAGEVLLAQQAALTSTLRDLALEYRELICVGRTHGIHAEPMSFGFKLATHAFESRRNEERLERAFVSAATGSLSGAVGTYATLPPSIEAEVMDELQIGTEDAATQVVARDRLAELMGTIAVSGSSLDRLATELRHLQRTELREAEEAFTVGQKGSSAMPHKRNPITAERISGLARVLRSNAQAAFENVPLWHERDISHSSVERVIVPDSLTLLDYLLEKSRDLVANLVVHPERMQTVLESSGGLVFSQRVLLALVDSGLTREEAYALVQRNGLASWDSGRPLRELLNEDAEVTARISPDQLEALFDPAWYTRNLDAVWDRLTAL